MSMKQCIDRVRDRLAKIHPENVGTSQAIEMLRLFRTILDMLERIADKVEGGDDGDDS